MLAEVSYWLNEHGGPEVEAAFLDSVADGTFTLVDLTSADVVAVAERLHVCRTESLSQRDRLIRLTAPDPYHNASTRSARG